MAGKICRNSFKPCVAREQSGLQITLSISWGNNSEEQLREAVQGHGCCSRLPGLRIQSQPWLWDGMGWRDLKIILADVRQRLLGTGP